MGELRRQRPRPARRSVANFDPVTHFHPLTNTVGVEWSNRSPQGPEGPISGEATHDLARAADLSGRWRVHLSLSTNSLGERLEIGRFGWFVPTLLVNDGSTVV